MLLVSLVTIRFAGPFMISRIGGLAIQCFSNFPKSDLTTASIRPGLVQLLLDMAMVLGPLLAAVFITGFVSNAAQVGLVFSWEPLAPKGSRLNPLSGLSRMFSTRSAVELGKSISKVTIIGYLVFSCLRDSTRMLSG